MSFRPNRHDRLRGQRGEGNLGCIFWAVVLLLVCWAAWTLVPVRVATAQLYDYMEQQALVAEQVSPEVIKRRILAKAQDLDLPVDASQVDVSRRGDRIYMSAQYTVPVDFGLGIVFDWKFEHDIDRPIFIV